MVLSGLLDLLASPIGLAATLAVLLSLVAWLLARQVRRGS
jgi:hypothetical protein